MELEELKKEIEYVLNNVPDRKNQIDLLISNCKIFAADKVLEYIDSKQFNFNTK